MRNKAFLILTLCLALFWVGMISLFAQTPDPVIASGLWAILQPFINAHPWVVYVLLIVALTSELLGNIQSIKANSVYQLIQGWLLWIYNKITGQNPPAANPPAVNTGA